jgi:cytochrome P450
VHRCLGAAFALTEMEVLLRTMLCLADLRPDRMAEEGATTRTIILVPKRGARVRLVSRR